MTKTTLNAQIEQLLDNLDTQEKVAEATKLLNERFFEKSLNIELDDHLGYQKHPPKADNNTRNGVMSKTVQTEDGPLDIDTPRDRDGSF